MRKQFNVTFYPRLTPSHLAVSEFKYDNKLFLLLRVYLSACSDLLSAVYSLIDEKVSQHTDDASSKIFVETGSACSKIFLPIGIMKSLNLFRTV